MGLPREPSVFKPDSIVEGVTPQDIMDNCIESRHIANGEIEGKHLSENIRLEKLKIGTTTNYTEFENDGTPRYKGDATSWKDVVNSLIGRRLFGIAGRVDYDWGDNSITFQNNGNIASDGDRIVWNDEYNHENKTDGKMYLHIHWEQVSTNKIEFTVQYRIQINGQAKTTNWTTITSNSDDNNVFAYASGTLNQITKLAEIDLTDAGLSPTIQFRLARTDSTIGDIQVTFVDSHVEVDSPGSREEYVK